MTLAQLIEALRLSRGPPLTRNDSVGTSNRRNDVFDYPLCQAPCNPLNLELICAGKGCLVQPFDVLGIIVVKFFVCDDGSDSVRHVGKALVLGIERTFENSWPFEHASPFDAVFW